MAKDGSLAESPLQIGWPGWKAILLRVKDELKSDRVGVVAAGIAFYGLLALFPAITALMAIAGLFLTPSDVTEQIQNLSQMLPPKAAQIVIDQAIQVAGSRDGGLGLAAAGGIILALYSASKGVANLVEGLNIAYEEAETRGFIRLKLTTLAITAMLIIGLAVGIAAVLVIPAVLAIFPLGPLGEALVMISRWVILFAMTTGGIAILYRYGPDRRPAQWRWILPGALLACLLWILGSAGFSLYAQNFGSYQETFGSLAGGIILLMWLWISAYVILLGAEVNSEMEGQTRYDTTVGPERAPGSRGAVKADAFSGADL